MSNCDHIDLIGYLDGRDPDGQTGKHISSCTRCRQALTDYKLLIQAMAPRQYAAEGGPCHKKKTVILAAVGGDVPDEAHLNQCPDCKRLFERISEAITSLEQEMPTPFTPLPQRVVDLVVKQKKSRQAEQLYKVLDFQGIKDQKAKDADIRNLLGEREADDALPRAAFPDDLAEEGDDPEEPS